MHGVPAWLTIAQQVGSTGRMLGKWSASAHSAEPLLTATVAALKMVR